MNANKTKSSGTETAQLRVLLYDIETSPNVAYIWGKYEQDALGDFIKERQIISVAWKWLDEKKVNVLAIPMLKTYKSRPDDNTELIRKLHELMGQADVVVGHNVQEFDDKMVNTEFLSLGLTPPPPHRVIDTLAVARSRFRFNSNKLGDLGKKLGLGGKVHTGGFELWAACLRGDAKAWANMMAYNIGDVLLLEKVYLKMRPWMSRHPHMDPEKNKACRNCASKHIIRRGWRINRMGKYMRFQCQSCGTWMTGQTISRDFRFR